MKISQREARRLRKRVQQLEELGRQQRNAWATDYPGGVHIASCVYAPAARAVEVARKLRHAVVVIQDGDTLRFYGLPVSAEASR